MTDKFEVSSGLPEEPWHTGRLPPSIWRYICDAKGNTIAAVSEWDEAGNLVQDFGGREQAFAVAHAIAAIPAMVEEIERLQREIETARDAAGQVGRMCCLYAEEPNEKGQKSFSGCLVDSVAITCISIAYPLREMCRHSDIDKHAGICRLCHINVEDIPNAEG